MISRSTLSGATRIAIASATARFATDSKIEMFKVAKMILTITKMPKKKNEKIKKSKMIY